MKKCFRCGKELDDDSRFCVSCGVEQSQNGFNAAGGQNGSSSGKQSWYTCNDRTSEYDSADIAKNKSYGIAACIPILFFIPLVSCPESKYGKFCANQGLLLLILGAVSGIITSVIKGMLSVVRAVFGRFFIVRIATAGLSGTIEFLLWALIAALFVIAFIGACKGEAKELPVIGKLRILSK